MAIIIRQIKVKLAYDTESKTFSLKFDKKQFKDILDR